MELLFGDEVVPLTPVWWVNWCFHLVLMACCHCLFLCFVFSPQCKARYCDLPVECHLCGEFFYCAYYKHSTIDIWFLFVGKGILCARFVEMWAVMQCPCWHTYTHTHARTHTRTHVHTQTCSWVYHVTFSIPCPCPVSAAGLMLVLAPHIARSYHHLFPLDTFAEEMLEHR